MNASSFQLGGGKDRAIKSDTNRIVRYVLKSRSISFLHFMSNWLESKRMNWMAIFESQLLEWAQLRIKKRPKIELRQSFEHSVCVRVNICSVIHSGSLVRAKTLDGYDLVIYFCWKSYPSQISCHDKRSKCVCCERERVHYGYISFVFRSDPIKFATPLAMNVNMVIESLEFSLLANEKREKERATCEWEGVQNERTHRIEFHLIIELETLIFARMWTNWWHSFA